MRELNHSPSEYYIRYLITRQYKERSDRLLLKAFPELQAPGEEEEGELSLIDPDEIKGWLDALQIDSLSYSYIEDLYEQLKPFPDPFSPENAYHHPTKDFLRHHRIFEMWHPTEGVKECKLILCDYYLRDKLEPLLLSAIPHDQIGKKLRRYTNIALTGAGIRTYAHYFWNRKLLTQTQWVEYLQSRKANNPYMQGLMMSPDISEHHLPWVLGLSGPPQNFNTAEAASRMAQIALKYALELEHRPATGENVQSLRNCIVTLEKADTIMRRSDVALKDVLSQFNKFKMKVSEAKIIDVRQLTGGNFSQSGEGTDALDSDDF